MVTADGSTFRIERVKPRVKTSLHEILKYKLNNLHVQIFLHVVCFYFACYSSGVEEFSGSRRDPIKLYLYLQSV